LNSYLDKYAFRIRQIMERPHEDLGIVVVIPSYNEMQIDHALSALYNCTLPPCAVEVIVVVNASEAAAPAILHANAITVELCKRWKTQHDSAYFKIHLIEELSLPKRKAGVGLARKIGMDEAVRRLEDVQRPDGLIACFDADCTCSPNYLMALYTHFENHPKSPGCTVRFAYPTFGTAYPAENYLAIAYHELHLRYYNQAMRASGFSNAYHSLGTAIVVRASAYQKQGGMNTRTTDEDFYFLQLIIGMGRFTELHTTVIEPSPRTSHRVPFGTGKAIADFLESERKGYYTFNLQAFRYLHTFFKHIPEFYITAPKLEHLGGDLPYILIDFLSTYFFEERIAEIAGNSRGYNSFERRFFRWFDALMVLKFVHFVRDNAHPNVRVERAALDLLRAAKHPKVGEIRSINELLNTYRSIEAAPRRYQLRFK
jgi:glycosyltransferase involved in cell wall biosynthesis